ncbi:MAG TPA: hypothetical protein VFH26_11520 [Gemmatimonadales bacterium]|nr:hypothetical protein [Gemmatimonadales bacterium]
MSYGAQLGAAVALAAALAACSGSERPSSDTTASAGAPGPAAPAAITVTAKDYSFEGPAQVSAGLVSIDLENHGKEVHQAQLVKLEDGKTLKDLAEALKNHGPPPSWLKWMGGPNAVAPGQRVTASSVLTPGQYAYLCLIPSPDGKMHVAKGMVRPFEVMAASSASSAGLPSADHTIKLVDYDFQQSQPLTAGRRTILVENTGPQPHELVLLKLPAGKKVEDFARWAESMKGPPPAEPVGGVVVLEKGGRATFTADLQAGDYGLICFVPDSKDGKPHLVHGMMKNIKVG